MERPNIIGGIDVNRTYTPEDIFEMSRDDRLRNVVLEGYCTRVDDDGIRFVPWYESTHFRDEQGTPQTHVSHDFVPYMKDKLEREHPIIRRTPQERTAAMALRILGEVKRSGRVTGLSDEELKTIVGESFKAGEPVTGSDIQAVAARLLGTAEKHNREADSHRVTRQHMTA